MLPLLCWNAPPTRLVSASVCPSPQNLFVLAGQDPSKEIRKRVCQAFVLLLDSQYSLLAPHIEQVIQFMLAASNDDDEGVCLEACEFWSAYCEIKQLDVALLRKYLDHLVPILLKAMCYSADELGMLGEEDDEGRLPFDTDATGCARRTDGHLHAGIACCSRHGLGISWPTRM